MKKIFTQALRSFGNASQLKLPVGLAVIMLLIGIGLLLLIPVYPLWALKLIGLPITITLRSYFGSLLMIAFFLWIRSLNNTPKNK